MQLHQPPQRRNKLLSYGLHRLAIQAVVHGTVWIDWIDTQGKGLAGAEAGLACLRRVTKKFRACLQLLALMKDHVHRIAQVVDHKTSCRAGAERISMSSYVAESVKVEAHELAQRLPLEDLRGG